MLFRVFSDQYSMHNSISLFFFFFSQFSFTRSPKSVNITFLLFLQWKIENTIHNGLMYLFAIVNSNGNRRVHAVGVMKCFCLCVAFDFIFHSFCFIWFSSCSIYLCRLFVVAVCYSDAISWIKSFLNRNFLVYSTFSDESRSVIGSYTCNHINSINLRFWTRACRL